ncbi:MAG: CTP synthase [Candidatus Magnetoovum sp. WYHC-5]|nr:CTP synthase [Candidatus Magnetoovum sp. WYHC-5]
MAKYIFLTGGVVSSLGKGIAASAVGALLEARGIQVNIQKLDPYINIDPGTLSPYQHGEVFVADDGTEADLDLGHYERFTHITTAKANNYTTGKIYYNVIEKERRGEYLGETVQVVPHITDEIKAVIKAAGANVDVLIVEIGGTIGDIESLPFLEAIRQMPYDVGKNHVMYLHLTLVPYIPTAGELKTKPSQHSVKELRAIGIQPDALICRCDRTLPPDIKKKIALHTNLEEEAVISAVDVETIYEVPIVFHNEGLDDIITRKFKFETKEPNLSKWQRVAKRVKSPVNQVKIALVGKYTGLKDSYKSLTEALIHGGIANEAKVVFKWLDSEALEKTANNALGSLDDNTLERYLGDTDGILIPGGFGQRGIEGKICAAGYARRKGIPFFGICLGMQCAVIEFARSVCGLKEANSTEFDINTPEPVIYLMQQWYNERTGGIERRDMESEKGGTMRLGAYPCVIKACTHTMAAYGQTLISERHRHRYEFNNSYRQILQASGLSIVGTSPDNTLVEMIEIESHPWFVGCQFHPEFKSRPTEPHPLFKAFIWSCLKEKHALFPYVGAQEHTADIQ